MARLSRRWSACVVVLALGLAESALAWEIPLTVQEYGATGRQDWDLGGTRRVTGGVPLLPGQAQEASQLRLLARDAAGEATAVPAQFRVLARWWRGDNSIRWVLVDFVVTLKSYEQRTFYLTTGGEPAPAPEQPARAEEADDSVVVTTGPAQFVINKKQFAFLDQVRIDADGDGAFGREEQLLETTPDMGTVLEDTFGQNYFCSEGTRSVEVLEAGPMRVCVRARGMHRAREGKGYGPGMYSYDYFMHFYAGSADVYVDCIIGNNPPKSTGSPIFEDASLVMKLAGGATGCGLYGAAPFDGLFSPGESVAVYQDSNGAETWQRNTGYHTPANPVRFRGYRLLRRTTGRETLREQVVTQGDHARGLAHIYNDNGGIVCHTRHFWEEFPKAVEVFQDGRLRVGLFPRECALPHYLEDACAKGHELFFHFYKRKAAAQEASRRPPAVMPHGFADIWDRPVYPRPPIEHLAATGALTDLGPYTVPQRGYASVSLEYKHRRHLMTDRWWGHGYGWQVFGSVWRCLGGHSSRGARQPIRDDNYLYLYLTTGHPEWLEFGNRRSRHFRDVRCYRIEGQDPFGFKSWETFQRANRSEDWTSRPQPDTEESRKYTQGFWPRATWWLPNPAHMVLDLLYDRYLMFGDIRSFENMRVVAGHGGNYAAYRKPVVHRATGWSWRTLERYWELTGDKDAEACLMDTLKNYESMIGTDVPLPKAGGGEINWWFTQVFSRAVAMTALNTGDKRALDLCKTLVKKVPEKQARYFCTLFAVLYHLTGEEKYKTAVMAASDGGRALLTVGTSGDFPATAHWLLHQPPKRAGGGAVH